MRQYATRCIRLAIVVAAWTCGACERAISRPPDSQPAPREEPVVEVATARVQRGSILQRVTAPGSVVARRESRIGSELRGRILEVHVSEGDRVQAGDVLFRIDPEPWEVALRQAEAGLDLARAERRQIDSDLGRARELRGREVVSEQEIDRLSTALSVARARERQAGEAVALARHNLERTVVSAPYAGSVAARLADEGTTALVQPQTIVVVLQEAAELEAHAAIPESEMSLVQKGDRALVHVEGLKEAIETRVSAVSDTIDPATRTYLVKMRVPNPDHLVKAGIFARVEIRPDAKSDVVLVPRESIRSEEGRTRVLVVRDGRAAAVAVEIGIVSEEAAEVLGGISVNDAVIVGEAARSIAPGMRVRVASEAGGET